MYTTVEKKCDMPESLLVLSPFQLYLIFVTNKTIVPSCHDIHSREERETKINTKTST